MDSDEHGLHPGWYTLILVVVFAVLIWLSYALFAGTLKKEVPVTLTSDRAGLVMETNAKVKMRGVQSAASRPSASVERAGHPSP